ncbi:MADS-box transcription factor 27 [Bienertia sinuspersici]
MSHPSKTAPTPHSTSDSKSMHTINNVANFLQDQLLSNEIKELNQRGAIIHQENIELYKQFSAVQQQNSELQKKVSEAEDVNPTEQHSHMSYNVKNSVYLTTPISLELSQPKQQINETSARNMKLW